MANKVCALLSPRKGKNILPLCFLQRSIRIVGQIYLPGRYLVSSLRNFDQPSLFVIIIDCMMEIGGWIACIMNSVVVNDSPCHCIVEVSGLYCKGSIGVNAIDTIDKLMGYHPHAGRVGVIWNVV